MASSLVPGSQLSLSLLKTDLLPKSLVAQLQTTVNSLQWSPFEMGQVFLKAVMWFGFLDVLCSTTFISLYSEIITEMIDFVFHMGFRIAF